MYKAVAEFLVDMAVSKEEFKKFVNSSDSMKQDISFLSGVITALVVRGIISLFKKRD